MKQNGNPASTRPEDRGQSRFTDWADPGYTRPGQRWRNLLRLSWQLIRPPRGHRISPTRTGVLLILVSLAIGTAAFNTAQNILYIALAFMLASLVLSGILSWCNFKGCQWQLHVPRHLRVGEHNPVVVLVRNQKRWLPSYSFAFILRTVVGGQRHMLWMTDPLQPGRQLRLDWNLKPERRGLETVLLEGLVSRYPFGFLQKTIRDSVRVEVPVWPARIAYQWRDGQVVAFRRHAGRQTRRTGGVELHRIRDYVRGDALRSVHWRASARAGKLLVKEMRDEGQSQFRLWVDSDHLLWPDAEVFEKMCSLAATLMEDLFRLRRLQVVKIGESPAIATHGAADLHACMNALAVVQPGTVSDGDCPPDRDEWLQLRPGAGGKVQAAMKGVVIGEV